MSTTAPVTAREMVDLRATAAMRREDLRIATKHREEAGARTMTPSSRSAYVSALAWEDTCREADRVARAAVIDASLSA